jgi:tetratricopeptide (TPR) repeat protein
MNDSAVQRNAAGLSAWDLIEIGDLLDDVGKTDEAIQAYSDAIAVGGRNVDAYRNRGILHESLQNLPAAIEDFANALSCVDTLFDAAEISNWKFLLHQDLGEVYLKQDNYEKAIFHLTEAVVLNPNDIFAHYCLARAYDPSKRKDGGGDSAKASQYYQMAAQVGAGKKFL